MGRVTAYANEISADYYGGLGRQGTEAEYLADNIAFINEKMDQGLTIVDIGPSPNYKQYPNITSTYYAAEITHIANRYGPMVPYEHYRIDEGYFQKWRNDRR
jgi:protein tyrosine phosphatase